MNDDTAIGLYAIGYLLLGLLGMALLVAPILVPLLYKTRLAVRLRVTTTGGEPLAGVRIRGIRNRAGPALQATGEGFLAGGQLHAVGDKLGQTDAQGRFQRTYYFRNFHTLWIGERELFITPGMAAKMRTEDHELTMNPPAVPRAGAGAPDAVDEWTKKFQGE